VARTVEQLDEVAAQIEERGGQALVAPGDVTDRLGVESIVARVERELGPIDLLVNCAGAGRLTEFLPTAPETWWRTVEVNLLGPLLCTHVVLRRMVPRRRGRIVNIGGGMAARPSPLGSDLAASKAALLRLTDCVAEAMWENSISIFAVDPGLVHTDFTSRGYEDVPLQGWTPVEEVGRLVARLASGRADALSGRCVRVQDDLDELLQHLGEIESDSLYRLGLRVYEPRPWVPPGADGPIPADEPLPTLGT
jgi:NAD(P)-dependent dehydrogenase (short-subunit alcohol dehydrogenase family)